MNIEELNKYLQTNVKCSLERFNNPAPFVDDYDMFRRDDTIYCYSAMIILVLRTSSDPSFCQWLLDRVDSVEMMQYNYTENDVLLCTYNAIKADGDDLCDEQSVGWYLGVYTYIYCLIHNDYGYEQIFCNGWNLYYSVAFQNKIRNSI